MKTTDLLRQYLDAIGIQKYNITEAQDSLGYLICVTVGKNDPALGVLLGRGGTHLYNLKKVLRVVGFIEKIRPCIILKLI